MGVSSGRSQWNWRPARPSTCRANSITAICIPRQMPRIGHAVLPGVPDGGDFALHAPVAEAAGHQNAVRSPPRARPAFLVRHRLRVDPLDVAPCASLAMPPWLQRLHHAEIGVVQLHILAHQGDVHLAAAALAGPVHHGLPLPQDPACVAVRPSVPAHHIVPAPPAPAAAAPRRGCRAVDVLDDAFRLHIAEQGDLLRGSPP